MISYKKLFKLLIDKDMIKSDLKSQAKLSSVTMSKLSANESVTISTINRICKVLQCQPGDILEYIDDDK